MRDLIEVISNFKNNKVLVVGDVMVDEFVWGSVSRISPEAPVPVVDVASETFTPGGAGNVVNNIHSLGGEVFVAGVIGEDKVGERLVNELRNKGINVEGLIVDGERPTTLKTRIIAHSQQVVRVDREKREAISGYITGQILNYVRKVLPEIGALVLSDYGKGVITPRLLEEIIPLARRNDKIIVVDPKVGNYLNYKYTTVICPNKAEASALTKMEIRDEESLQEVGLQILRDLECDAVLITRGEEGMSLFESEGSVVHIPTVAREVYDVTGAGDTVVSTLALALSSGANMQEASILANYAAGVVVGEVGTATVTPAELKSEVEKGLHLSKDERKDKRKRGA